MSLASFERIFEADRICKRERVERTLNLQPVDRAAIHDQLSYNPGVISLYTGRRVQGFDYSYQDICSVIRRTLDACFPPVAPVGTGLATDEEGFSVQRDNWTSWTVSRPFTDVAGAKEYLQRSILRMQRTELRPAQARQQFRDSMLDLQRLIGETVIIDTSSAVGLCPCWSRLGLELFVHLYAEDSGVVSEFIETYANQELRRVDAIADPQLSPVILIADDFATKQGPIFSPAFLRKEHFPRLRRLTEAWHSHGLKVLYHSDGNWRSVIPDLVACGLDGFYCLEPSVGMDVVELKKAWPRHVWAGGVDGVDLMERGTPEQVRREVRRHILETGVLQSGGMFVGTSSEINPPIKPENYQAMVEAVGTLLNPDFHVA